jgi:hypothetical protein
MKKNSSTPWGPAQSVSEIIPGMWHVSTAGHGGIYVSPELYAQMPSYMKATPYSSAGWFEEDIDWVLPFVVFEKQIREQATDAQTLSTINEGVHQGYFECTYHSTRRAQWFADYQEVSK